MSAMRKSVKSRKSSRLQVVSAIKGPIAFMHRGDIGKLVACGSKRAGRKLKPNYAVHEDGVDTVKVLMATDTVISFEAFRPKGAADTVHQHEALEDSVRIETKIYPAGGAVASWNTLVRKLE